MACVRESKLCSLSWWILWLFVCMWCVRVLLVAGRGGRRPPRVRPPQPLPASYPPCPSSQSVSYSCFIRPVSTWHKPRPSLPSALHTRAQAEPSSSPPTVMTPRRLVVRRRLAVLLSVCRRPRSAAGAAAFSGCFLLPASWQCPGSSLLEQSPTSRSSSYAAPARPCP